ncbi:MAG: pantoate--beta-alanine ligase [bacterium (Candidatus Stahlbacteria) CG08_land_8_20_14_0_20_40_26]|nr:MAG: pantoate--beta-alanine ligase [bacterium (Candidatus Stahlbacteria) CG23_combo_of_CG06-09_8_20_14_all_40_9]PIS25950.1 MAG: pantoate--beta-alanine ligase [bacterium (Candidatus Stahlbacteria) CG08_land_8_20_14_0_20_40_26]
MKVITTVKNMQLLSYELRKEEKIGFVPTMGFLHKGHLSLIDRARSLSEIVVVSIFVNPKQFGPSEDYLTYPRDFERDKQLLKERDVDILFYPDIKDMYPTGYSTYVEVEGFDATLCGARRPGHMRGVATVCMKLFNIVRPHLAVFGEKDYQQAILIKRMVSDTNLDVEIVLSPTVREGDGLAVSSRNIHLTDKERKDAAVLYKSLLFGKNLVEEGEDNTDKIIKTIRKMIEGKRTARIDYIEVVDSKNLKLVKTINKPVLLALAVYFGRTKLIDNIIAVPKWQIGDCRF